MIEAEDFCDELAARGFTAASGVPCSHFSGPISVLGRRGDSYVAAANEGTALATAAGAALAGERAYVMVQNSGLGNLVNPLTSLVVPYGLPVLSFVSLRGWPDPDTDEPQHRLMGTATDGLLAALGMPRLLLDAGGTLDGFRRLLDSASGELDAGRAPFVLVERGAVGPDRAAAVEPTAPAGGRVPPADVLAAVVAAAPDAAVFATTGYTGRELFALADRPAHFYMQGSMGHVSSLALGAARARPARTVVVLDGDGAALMHLGALSQIGHHAPPNLVHLVLDNGVHESTGGQPTTSGTASFPAVALACGYASAAECPTGDALRLSLAAALASPGPHLLSVPTAPRTGAIPPRATNAIGAEELRDRFRRFLA
ncbi:phosphonopyruvate decarboxylase [Streptomyces sp. NPDC047002]|uniref:phosphonopyruvate decarboxylase n=1 Tax=Streptomyces sp. NPDC047002 TaxID=3155475 RepID=UPI0034551397